MHVICPPPPPQIFSISLGTAVIPRRNEKRRLCKTLGGKKSALWKIWKWDIGSLISNGLLIDFERCTSTGSGLYFIACNVFAKMFGKIVRIRVKKRSKTNVLASRHFKRYKALTYFRFKCIDQKRLCISFLMFDYSGSRAPTT